MFPELSNALLRQALVLQKNLRHELLGQHAEELAEEAHALLADAGRPLRFQDGTRFAGAKRFSYGFSRYGFKGETLFLRFQPRNPPFRCG